MLCESHSIWNNPPTLFDITVTSIEIRRYFQSFLAFLEYTNFKLCAAITRFLDKIRLKWSFWLALEQNSFLCLFLFYKIFIYILYNIFRKSRKKPWKKGQPTCFFTKEKAYQYQIIYPKLTRSFRRIQKISKMSLKLTLKNIAVLCNMGVAQPRGLPRPFSGVSSFDTKDLEHELEVEFKRKLQPVLNVGVAYATRIWPKGCHTH